MTNDAGVDITNERMPFQPYNNIFRQQRKLAAGQLGNRATIA